MQKRNLMTTLLSLQMTLFSCAKQPMKSLDNRSTETTPPSAEASSNSGEQETLQLASSLGIDQATASQYLALCNESTMSQLGTILVPVKAGLKLCPAAVLGSLVSSLFVI